MSACTSRRPGFRRGPGWGVAVLVALAFGACGDDPIPASDVHDAIDGRDGAADADGAGDGLAVDAAGDAAGDDARDVAPDGDDSDAQEDVDPGDTGLGDADLGDTAPDDTAPDDTDLGDTDLGDTALDETRLEDTGAADDTTAPDDTTATDVLDDETTPAGPFDDLAGLSGPDLKVALLARITNHTALGYEGDGLAREVMFAVIDAHDGRLECIYTGRTVAAENALAPPLGTAAATPIDTTPNQDCRWPEGDPVPGGCAFNAEHSWPRSLGADGTPASSDLHHLFPAYDMANNQRSNYLFGDTTCTGSNCLWAEGSSELGWSAEDQKVFEVRPRYRGDIARAQFYFAVRYTKTIGATTEATLRAWHAQDPPDDEERARNTAIEAWQHNRNPFVDRPDFVGHIGDF